MPLYRVRQPWFTGETLLRATPEGPLVVSLAEGETAPRGWEPLAELGPQDPEPIVVETPWRQGRPTAGQHENQPRAAACPTPTSTAAPMPPEKRPPPIVGRSADRKVAG